MFHHDALLTILLMASATYSTRIIGYLLLRNRTLSPRALAVIDAAPGCVLTAVLAPAFVSTQPTTLIALVVCMVAATRLSMFPTVVIGMASAALLRALLV